MRISSLSKNWDHGEKNVSLENGIFATLTQPKKIVDEDYLTIRRTICDYDNTYIYEICVFDPGTILRFIYVRDNEMEKFLKENTVAMMHGRLSIAVRGYFN